MYLPGTHLIATLSSKHTQRLIAFEELKALLDQLILESGLKNLGEVYHNFSPQGFTAVVCLSESHISIHTWPEYGKINLDIYLSNFQQVNDQIVHKVFNSMVEHFDADIVDQYELKR